MTSVKTRLFLGVELDDETKHLVAARLSDLLDRMPGRAVAPRNWHLTLRFLGWAEEAVRDRIVSWVEEHLEEPPFPVALGGLGAFPKPRRATVLWVGVASGAEELARVAAVTEQAAEVAGFEPESRPYHPHLTLSRIRPPEDVTALVEATEPIAVRFQVDHVALFRSTLRPGGAEYDVVDRIPL